MERRQFLCILEQIPYCGIDNDGCAEIFTSVNHTVSDTTDFVHIRQDSPLTVYKKCQQGMYRLMMIESGGDASVVGPGGYFGLFQYAPTTWKGSWNPYRGHSITDGAAQIKATALAIKLGYGHAWWDPSYSWAFGGG